MAWWDREKLKPLKDRSERYKKAFPEEYEKGDDKMPKYSLDPESKKLVENPNYKEKPIKARKYTAQDAIKWKEIESAPPGYNESMPWTQEEYEQAEDLVALYRKYGVFDKFGKPMTDKEMFDQQPSAESIHAAFLEGTATKADIAREHGRWPETLPTNTRFREEHYLQEVQDYIAKTYKEHYAQGDTQIFETITTSGHADGFAMGNILKLAARYGRKEGYNRKDLFKIIHYALLELWVHDNADR